MENVNKQAIQGIASMIERSRKALEKFPQGISQHTLLKNRIEALSIALALVAEEEGSNIFAKNDLKKAIAPITSLIHKSEKAQRKLSQGTWQYTMLENNLQALYMALVLIKNQEASIE